VLDVTDRSFVERNASWGTNELCMFSDRFVLVPPCGLLSPVWEAQMTLAVINTQGMQKHVARIYVDLLNRFKVSFQGPINFEEISICSTLGEFAKRFKQLWLLIYVVTSFCFLLHFRVHRDKIQKRIKFLVCHDWARGDKNPYMRWNRFSCDRFSPW